MNYIELDFIPIKINKSYKQCCKEIIDKSRVILFDKIDTSISICKSGFDKVSIDFIFDDDLHKDEVYEELIKKYGKPHFLSISLLKIWKVNDFYISYGSVTTYPYDTNYYVLKVSLYNPAYIKYDLYIQYTSALRSVYNQWNLSLLLKPHIGSDNLFKEVSCLYESTNYRYSFSIYNKKVRMCSYKKTIRNNRLKLIKGHSKKVKFKNIDEIAAIINSYLVNMKKVDNSLSKK